jgi:hypothetical protein
MKSVEAIVAMGLWPAERFPARNQNGSLAAAERRVHLQSTANHFFSSHYSILNNHFLQSCIGVRRKNSTERSKDQAKANQKTGHGYLHPGNTVFGGVGSFFFTLL